MFWDLRPRGLEAVVPIDLDAWSVDVEPARESRT